VILKASYFVLLLFSLQVLSYSQQYWIAQPCPTTKYLNKIIFVDSLYGWAVGDSGTVIHTTNGGSTWFVQSELTNWVINWITFVNRNTGWVIYNTYSPGGTTFLKTTNGGYNWQSIPNPDSTVTFITMCFLDSLKGFAAGDNSKPYRTTNGGTTWILCNTDSTVYSHLPIRRIRFYNNLLGFACGGQFDFGGVIWKTTDGGVNWVSMIVSAEPEFDLKIRTPSDIFSVGGDLEYGSAVVYTTNNGSNWSYENLQCAGIAYTLAFRTPSEVWVPLGGIDRWAVSTDSGNAFSWQCIVNPDTEAVYDAVFLSPASGWAVGCRGRNCTGILLKYNPAIIGILPNARVPDRFSLSQNYPNPFNPNTTIKFQLPKQAFVSIKVYDLLGKLVSTLVNENKDAGYYDIKFDASKLASGLYIYKIEARQIAVPDSRQGSSIGEFTETKKMMLIK
jgi:photosystem II stability/assembly factor-like uncharacterized protein